jgi:DNA-binding NtrC family response regulator
MTPRTVISLDAEARSWPGLHGAPELLGCSPEIGRVQELVCRAAAQDACVLITAEPGTVVESVAAELHRRSPRTLAAFVVVDCTLGDAGRLERALFGVTPPDVPNDLEWVSADSRIAIACGGTLFLQDVNDLPAAVQARVARIARDGQFRTARSAQPATFRLVASAPRGIEGEVRTHRFRLDLYRRLAAMRIDVPPLRERAEDVPVLASRVLEDICRAEGLPVRTFTQAALALLGALSWPGNLTELHDVILRAVRSHDPGGEVIQIEDLLPAVRLNPPAAPFVPAGNLREARLRFEREYIGAVLQHHRWRMSEAAETLGMLRPNLYRKARQLGIPLTRVPE